ncbi:MAG: hypothetical protein ACUVV6_06720 [Thermoplasmatota archaeon]
MPGARAPHTAARPEGERAGEGACGRPGAAEAVRALEECRAALARARQSGAGVREAERLLRIAEGYVRSGSYRLGARCAGRARELLEASLGAGGRG